MTETTELRMKYAGVIGLLCEISPRITDDDEKESLINAVQDWCDYTGWTMTLTLDRVEVVPPHADDAAGGAEAEE